MKKEYYFLEIDIISKKILDYGVTPHATHTGNTDNPKVHRVFLTKGQYNKVVAKL